MTLSSLPTFLSPLFLNVRTVLVVITLIFKRKDCRAHLKKEAVALVISFKIKNAFSTKRLAGQCHLTVVSVCVQPNRENECWQCLFLQAIV